jgi:hypothetical protein
LVFFESAINGVLVAEKCGDTLLFDLVGLGQLEVGQLYMLLGIAQSSVSIVEQEESQ